MTLKASFAIWNNKGGVGKSTITFHLATRFAELNEDKTVLVIDLCPQANSSMMLLGGAVAGETNVMSFCAAATPRTVVGYLSEVLSNGAGAPLPDPMDFIVKADQFNTNIPANVYLMSGDGNLEPMAPAINAAADAPPLRLGSNPWLWVHNVFRQLTTNLPVDKDWIVFVDTNPSFSIYTELAICTADKLLVPVNADDSSRVATNAMFILLHGTNPPHPVYGSWTFATKASTFGQAIPKVHLMVGNRLTQFSGAAAAFQALSDASADTLYGSFTKHPGYFTARSAPPTSLADFRERYSVPLRDFNTAGVVSAHLGRTLSSMKQGYYAVHNSNVKVNSDQTSEALKAIDQLISAL